MTAETTGEKRPFLTFFVLFLHVFRNTFKKVMKNMIKNREKMEIFGLIFHASHGILRCLLSSCR